MEDFNSLGIPEAVLQSLKEMQFQKPTPVQAQTIPPALQGLDVLGSAQTGTGKTAAYGIPLVSFLLNNPDKTALVLAPTRELALQVLNTLTAIAGRKSSINSVLLIGGKPMSIQFKQLNNRPRIIVATPGRANDHLTRGSLKLNNTEFLVLDETDRMLDMGFTVQIDNIIRYLAPKRQTLMFSATMAKEIVRTAEKYLTNAVRISVGSTTNPIEKIKQEAIHTSEPKKYSVLLEHLTQYEGSFIIFVKTKMGTERLASKLYEQGHNADAIHGDLRQREREKALRGFRDGSCRILVATDVAARGLDIPEIEVVVNYDLPQIPEDYIHRIGRTGRAGAEGLAINLITPQDNLKWKDICRLMNPDQKNDRQTDSYKRGSGRSNGRKTGGRGEREFGRSNFSGSANTSPKKSRFPDQNSRSPFGYGSAETSDNRSDRPSRFRDNASNPRSSFRSGEATNSRSDRPSRFRDNTSNPRSSFGSGEANSRSDRPSRFRDNTSNPRSSFGSGETTNSRSDRPSRFRDNTSNPRSNYGSSEGTHSRSDRPSRFRDNTSNPRSSFGSSEATNSRSDRPSRFRDNTSNPRSNYGSSEGTHSRSDRPSRFRDNTSNPRSSFGSGSTETSNGRSERSIRVRSGTGRKNDFETGRTEFDNSGTNRPSKDAAKSRPKFKSDDSKKPNAYQAHKARKAATPPLRFKHSTTVTT